MQEVLIQMEQWWVSTKVDSLVLHIDPLADDTVLTTAIATLLGVMANLWSVVSSDVDDAGWDVWLLDYDGYDLVTGPRQACVTSKLRANYNYVSRSPLVLADKPIENLRRSVPAGAHRESARTA